MSTWAIIWKRREDCTIDELKKKQKITMYLAVLLAIEAFMFVCFGVLLYVKHWIVTAAICFIFGMGYLTFCWLEIMEKNNFSMWIYLKRKLGD